MSSGPCQLLLLSSSSYMKHMNVVCGHSVMPCHVSHISLYKGTQCTVFLIVAEFDLCCRGCELKGVQDLREYTSSSLLVPF